MSHVARAVRRIAALRPYVESAAVPAVVALGMTPMFHGVMDTLRDLATSVDPDSLLSPFGLHFDAVSARSLMEMTSRAVAGDRKGASGLRHGLLIVSGIDVADTSPSEAVSRVKDIAVRALGNPGAGVVPSEDETTGPGDAEELDGAPCAPSFR
jgi:hypothetical protein